MKKWMSLLTVLVLGALLLAVPAMAEQDLAEKNAAEDKFEFADWNPEAESLKALIDYVEDVTDESSPNFIPAADRIATFDMDGTLCAELFPTYVEYYLLARRILTDESYTPDAEMLEFGRMLRDHAMDRSFPDGMDMLHATHAAKAYAGMTLQEFADFVTNQLVREADGFEGMTYANCFYTPMIEVVEYLQENDFKVFVVSGSDRFICRTFIEGVMDIPYEQIIGMDVQLEASHQDGKDGLDYAYASNDTVIRTDKLLIKTLKMNKVTAILQHIGRQPVLSFGNSGGDVSMHNFALFNNKYKSAAFMLIADDEERDYGNTEKTRALGEKWKESGYVVISMRDDFRTIYGDDVVKTGSFRWLEEMAENRTPADAEPAPEAAAEAQAEEDVQYVMYLGTNDKDTNRPIFTQAEAMEKAKEILVKHLDGYTMQEASGGWVDGDKLYQEYTLVISVSDTTKDSVYAAADELIQAFNQSSILIQTNPTKTEFYTPAK